MQGVPRGGRGGGLNSSSIKNTGAVDTLCSAATTGRVRGRPGGGNWEGRAGTHNFKSRSYRPLSEHTCLWAVVTAFARCAAGGSANSAARTRRRGHGTVLLVTMPCAGAGSECCCRRAAADAASARPPRATAAVGAAAAASQCARFRTLTFPLLDDCDRDGHLGYGSVAAAAAAARGPMLMS